MLTKVRPKVESGTRLPTLEVIAPEQGTSEALRDHYVTALAHEAERLRQRLDVPWDTAEQLDRAQREIHAALAALRSIEAVRDGCVGDVS
jgi:hypothetical protein